MGRKEGLTLGSLFDGIGGWLLAAEENGIEPVWSSEIDEYPAAVSKYHFRDVTQMGDITKLDGATLPPVDIICAGSPCQDISVAGKREGLNGERSGLFREATRIVHEMRKATGGKYPSWFVWENVPGAFNSNRGADFRTVLEEITKESIPMPGSGKWAKAGMVRGDKCDVAWRVLDAQYWGVPQRRKRIFLIADFREERLPEILFKPESVPGHLTAGKRKGEGTAINAKTGTRAASGAVVALEGNGARPSHKGSGYKETDVMYTLNTTEIHGIACQSYSEMKLSETGATIKATGGSYGMGSENLAMQRLASGKNVTGTLLANAGAKQWSGNQEALSGNFYVIEKKSSVVDFGRAADRIQINATKSVTLLEESGGGGGKTGLYLLSDGDSVANYIVRRLTPLECERLQGLPDGFTNIYFQGKPAPDNKRYKALGNGMAQPCADFVIGQIAKEWHSDNRANRRIFRSCGKFEDY